MAATLRCAIFARAISWRRTWLLCWTHAQLSHSLHTGCALFYSWPLSDTVTVLAVVWWCVDCIFFPPLSLMASTSLQMRDSSPCLIFILSSFFLFLAFYPGIILRFIVILDSFNRQSIKTKIGGPSFSTSTFVAADSFNVQSTFACWMRLGCVNVSLMQIRPHWRKVLNIQVIQIKSRWESISAKHLDLWFCILMWESILHHFAFDIYET